MLCQVYRSEKKQGAYLYLAHGKTLADIPEELNALLGQCVQVMQLNLAKRDKLASQNIEVVKQNLKEQGYHLQMPPKAAVQVLEYGK
ncbi:MAG: YcgL domain-containing protein [Marinicella sp.]|nr:YcgL domain-containing protein [Xanthomonadales bacterium]